MKKIIFVGQSRNIIKSFPQNVKRETGYQLDKIQSGKDPSDWKSINMVGSGVQEKKTRKTSKSDLNIAKTAYKNIVEFIKS